MKKSCTGLLAFVGACATAPILPVQVKIDPEFYKKHLSQPFPYSRELCFRATREAFKNLSYEILEANEKEFTIVTKKKKFVVPSTIEFSGTSKTTGMQGKGDSLSITTPHQGPEDYLAEQAEQYYMKISGDDSGCWVDATRWRAWNGTIELVELQRPGEDWAEDNRFKPFYLEVQDRLRSIAVKSDKSSKKDDGPLIQPIKTQRQY